MSADGTLDGVFAVTVAPGSGNVTQMELRRTDGGGTWDTLSSTGWWALGAAASLDGFLYNNSAAGVNFLINGGDTFYLFASDLSPTLFTTGKQFQLRVWFADGSIGTVTTTINPPPPPTLSLSFRGKVRDRVGKSNVAVAADGETDGVFAVTLASGSGSRTVVQMQLQRTDGSGYWDTTSTTNSWTLGAAGSLDGALNNNTSTATVNLPVGDGGTFYIFGADLSPSLYVVGAQFKVTAWLADGSIATATMTLSAPPPPTLSLSYRGKVRDRVGKGNAALAPDGSSDGVFAVNVGPDSGSRTILQMELRRTSGGDGVWDTISSTNWWALGAASSLDGSLYNTSAAAVNFDVGAGDTFYVFGGDLDPSLFVGGTTFQLTVWFADLSTATATTTMAPANTATPQIYGLADVGETLTLQAGSWDPPPNSRSDQWLRCDSLGGSCVALSGSTGTTYVVAAADLGATLRVRESATNSSGTTSVDSKQTPIVLAPLDELAFAHRPTLRFDSAELWRPLEISNFLSEHFQYRTPPTHQICDSTNWGGTQPGPCVPMTNPTTDMAANNTDHSYINISGDSPGELGSDNDACWSINGGTVQRQDCDSGAASAIYYEPGQDTANYRYIDYWWFLRDNDEAGVSSCDLCQHDEHEGDWEGVTVALDGAANSGAPPIAYVGYAAHDQFNWFLPDVLGGGPRPDVYSAMGTHASYPDACSSGCHQPAGSSIDAEASHDGQAGWGNNDDAACAGICLKRLGSWWTWWNGRWGGSEGQIDPRWGWSPQSPGLQPRFRCAESGFTGDCTRPPGARAPLARRGRRPPSPRVCVGWFGVDVAALACDATRLRFALRNHLMRRPGSLHLAVRGRRSGDAPGIAQVLGQPLRPGAEIRVTGHASPNTLFILDLRAARRYRATFTLRDLCVRARSGGAIKTKILIRSSNGRPILRTPLCRIPAELRLAR